MKDEYENPIPADLTLLQETGLLEKHINPIINDLDWYEPDVFPRRNQIFVSKRKLEEILDGFYSLYSPDELGLIGVNFLKIDRVLHRWNSTDGFYHA